MGHSEQARKFSCTEKYSDILKEEIQSWWIIASKKHELREKKEL